MRAGAASSVWVRLRLFVGSYVPLWVIIALRQESSASMWFFVALAVSGAVSTLSSSWTSTGSNLVPTVLPTSPIAVQK